MDPILVYSITAIVIFFSSLIRGATGFGLAMTSMPLLTLFLPFRETVTLVVIINLIFSLVHLIRSKGNIQRKEFILIIVFAIIGVSLGVLILKYINQHILKTITGVIIVLFGIAYIKGFSLKLKNQNKAFSLSAFAGGILAGSASIGGPIAAIILGGINLKPKQFRYAMSVFFLVTYSYATFMQGATGLIQIDTIYLALFTCPFLIAGLIAGEKIINRIDKRKFRRIVLILLLISGTLITIQGLKTLIVLT